jgi:LuxR family maltose regulon positive regulatory protein
VRPRVVEAVERELGNQLVILRAPRGAGKTEALAHVVADLRERGERVVSWASAADQTADVVWGRVLDGLAADAEDRAGELTDRIAAALADDPALIVLDDLSAATADAIADDLLSLLDACPGLCVVAAGRERTRLETPRVSVRCDTAVLDSGMLLFTAAETERLLALGGIASAPETADLTGRAVASWPAAIRLAAAHVRFRGESTLVESAVHGLAFTVLEEYAVDATAGLAPELARFAREAALAPHLTADLVADAAFTTGGEPPSELLAALERAGIGAWSTTDGEPRFTVTPVLRAPLLALAERESPSVALRIRRATAEHIGRHGDPLLAAELAADAGEWPLVVSLVENRFADSWRRDPARLERLTDRIPAALVDDSDSLGVSVMAAASDRSFTPLTLAQLTRLLVATRSARPTHDGDATVLALETRRLLLRRRVGEYGVAASTADRLAEVVDQHAARDRSPSDRRAEALLQIGLSYVHAGRPKEGRWRLTEAARSAVGGHLRVAAVGALALSDALLGNVGDASTWLASIGGDADASWRPSPWGIAAELARAAVAIEAGRTAEVMHILDQVERDYPTSEFWPVLGSLRATQHLLAGDAFGGMTVLRTLEDLNSVTPVSRPFDDHLDAARADLLVALRQSRRAVALLRSPTGVQDATAGALARALLFAGQDQHAYLVAQQWSSREQTSPRTTVHALLVRAVADLRMGRTEGARDAVARAVALSVSTGTMLPWSTIPAEDVERVVALVPASAQAMVTALPLQFRENLTIPVLSTREQIVLTKLQSGAPIAQIARSLVVSPNTVKTQVRSVYRKLGVSTRREAIRAAHEWGILRGETPGPVAMTGT